MKKERKRKKPKGEGDRVTENLILCKNTLRHNVKEGGSGVPLERGGIWPSPSPPTHTHTHTHVLTHIVTADRLLKEKRRYYVRCAGRKVTVGEVRLSGWTSGKSWAAAQAWAVLWHTAKQKHQLQPGERERDTHTHTSREGAGEGGSGGNRRKRERQRLEKRRKILPVLHTPIKSHHLTVSPPNFLPTVHVGPVQ